MERLTPHHAEEVEDGVPSKPVNDETEPLLRRRASTSSSDSQPLAKQLSTRHAFAVLVSLQIGSGIFASPAQVDYNVPSPGAALLVWVLGGLLSWAGAASLAELGAALPLNGGTLEYLRYVYGDTMAFLGAWIYIMGVKPSSMAIQSIVIAESVATISSARPLNAWALKGIAALAFLFTVAANSINTRWTLRLSEFFTVNKISTVLLIVIGGAIAVVAHLVDSNSSLSGATDWYTRNWFDNRPSVSKGHTIDWTAIGAWERYGHYSAAIYAGLWAYDGWDSANFVASEIRDPGRSLPKAIKAAMIVVLSCYELVNVAYYILLPWDAISSNNAVAVAAAKSLFGRPAGVIITILVAISCVGSITSNVFTGGRLIVAAAQHHYFPAILSKRGFQTSSGKRITESNTPTGLTFDAPVYANLLSTIVTLVFIFTGSFQALLTFVGMAEWVFYVSTVIGLLILRRREPELPRPYQIALPLPFIFIIVGTLVIVRSAIFAPIQSGVLAAMFVVGTMISKLRG
ncbi:amino acid/polyamine transporter I [Lophiotrema nucula]|uniref:Amino acid/polyamine transporter I n=1 Tax=Lophiotrema nucula TaxID=690887 RepID=A0A6A5YKD1_9PLEO|nr:amino acid/polyamine transporter I [Lophiotrema nucula]